MSPADPPDDADDLLAAEYVLGVLDARARRDAARRAEVDGAFAARVQAWEARLSPLNAAYPEVALPDLLPRIEARLFPARPRRRWVWAAGGVLAAGLALAVVLWPQPVPQARLVAGELVVSVRLQAGLLDLRRSGPSAGEDRDYQLWAIGADGVPRSLGLLRGESLTVPTDLQPGVTLAISLEPLGGAPGALPTGPVLASAVLGPG